MKTIVKSDIWKLNGAVTLRFRRRRTGDTAGLGTSSLFYDVTTHEVDTSIWGEMRPQRRQPEFICIACALHIVDKDGLPRLMAPILQRTQNQQSGKVPKNYQGYTSLYLTKGVTTKRTHSPGGKNSKRNSRAPRERTNPSSGFCFFLNMIIT